MNSREAKEILLLYRPRTADANDPEFSEALALAKKDPELATWFEQHCTLQTAVMTGWRRPGSAPPRGTCVTRSYFCWSAGRQKG